MRSLGSRKKIPTTKYIWRYIKKKSQDKYTIINQIYEKWEGNINKNQHDINNTTNKYDLKTIDINKQINDLDRNKSMLHTTLK